MSDLPNSNVQRFFDDLSGEYDAAIERCVPRYHEMLSMMLIYLPEELRPTRILELGCGSGNLTVRTAAEYEEAQLTVVDISPELLTACRERLQRRDVVCRQTDFRSLSLEANSFDLVLSSIAIHHLRPAEKQKLFMDVFDWLRPAGVFAMADQFAGATAASHARHMQLWRLEAERRGVDSAQWRLWMEHQDEHDFHEPLAQQMGYLREAGFCRIDCTWRHLLWTIIQCEKPAAV